MGWCALAVHRIFCPSFYRRWGISISSKFLAANSLSPRGQQVSAFTNIGWRPKGGGDEITSFNGNILFVFSSFLIQRCFERNGSTCSSGFYYTICLANCHVGDKLSGDHMLVKVFAAILMFGVLAGLMVSFFLGKLHK